MRILTNAQYDALVLRAVQGELADTMVNQAAQEIKRLLGEVASEKARADRAVDALLAVRGFPTVTPPRDGMPDIPDALEEDPEQVAKLEQRMAKGEVSVFTERF